MKIVVLGNPQALKRHRTFRKGNFTGEYDPSAGKKTDFLSVIQSQAPEKSFDCPLRVDMCFYFAHPKSHYRSGKFAGQLKLDAPVWHTTRPDRDNLDKFILDAMCGVFWRDDSIICDGRIQKLYDDRPRTEIEVTPLVSQPTEKQGVLCIGRA